MRHRVCFGVRERSEWLSLVPMSVTLTSTEALYALLGSTVSPRERLRLARGPLMDDLQVRLPALLGTQAAPALFRVQQAVRLDGYEVAAMQQGWGLFNPTRAVAASAWACARLTPAVQANAAGGLERALTHLGITAPVELLMVPADPANRNLMTRCHGLSVCALAPGWVMMEIWPSDGNLERLAPSLARAAVHQQWALARDHTGEPVTLAQALRIEAGAARLAATMELAAVGSLARLLFDPPADHDATLRHIASFYDLDDYDALDTNIYGGHDRGSASRVPALGPAPDMTPDERAYTVEAIASENETSDPVRVASCLYGDAAVQVWGHTGGGYSPLAGLGVATSDEG